MLDAIVAGHLCLDITPIIDRQTAHSPVFMAPGRLTEVGGAVLATGGAVSNTGQVLYILGMKVHLIARVGDDILGGLIRGILGRMNPEFERTPRTAHGEPSSYTIVIAPPDTDRTFLHCPGTNNTFSAQDIDDALLAQTRLFHLGYPPLLQRMYADGGSELAGIYRRAREAGATTALDLSLPDLSKPSGQANWPQILAQTLPYVDLFMPSVEELLLMLRREHYMELVEIVGQGGILDALTTTDIQELAEMSLHLGAAAVALKLGHRGLYLRTAENRVIQGRGAPVNADHWQAREMWAPCFEAVVASTAGAGDATIAGFLASLLRGEDIESAVTMAVAVGACNVEAMDTISGVRGWDETRARVQAGWPREQINSPGTDWCWDDGSQLWFGPNDSKRSSHAIS